MADTGRGHLYPDDLAALSLDGDRGDAAQRAHLDRCEACAGEYAAYRRIADRVRAAADALPPGDPTPEDDVGEVLWRRIADQVAEDEREAGAQQESSPGATATDLRADASPRHRGPRTWLLRAAGVVAVFAIGAAALVALAGQPTEERVAAATLTALNGDVADARAGVYTVDDGRELRVTLPEGVDDVAGEDTYWELWLIDESLDGMVSLGPVTAQTASVAVPAGVDIGDYPVVDVSLEPIDGDPTHSGDSRWRGALDAPPA